MRSGSLDRPSTRLGLLICASVGVASAAQPEVAELDEIVVTARKVEERLLETPVTLTAYTAEDLQRTNTLGIADLGLRTPGLFFSTSTGARTNDRIAIRGISSTSTTVGLVGIYLDGVYIPSTLASGLETSNLERIEVLKGPQSAVFGRATLSGAINYITKRPTDDWQGSANASFGERDYYDVNGLLSGPIAESWSFIVGARSYGRGPSYFNQQTQRKELGEQSSLGGLLGLRFQPSEAFDGYFRVLLGNDDDGPPAVYTQSPLLNNCLVAGGIPTYYCGELRADPNAINVATDNRTIPAPFFGTFQDDGKAGLNRDSARGMLELNWNLNDSVTLTSLSSVGREKVRNAFDLTTRAIFTNVTATRPTITFDQDLKFRDFSQELRASIDSDGPFSGLFGVYYLDTERTEFSPYRPLPEADGGTETTENFAAFGRLQWDVTDKLSLAAELRWQSDKNVLENRTTPFKAEVTTERTLPRFTIDYQFNEDFMVYGLASRGNRPASINTDAALQGCPERRATDEELTENIELGFKGRLFSNRVTFQASGYHIDWTNQTLSAVLQPGECGGNLDVIRYSITAGSTSVRGIELELNAQLIPDWWQVRLTWANNDTRIEEVDASTATIANEGILGFGTAGFTPLCIAANVAGMATTPVQSTLCPSLPQTGLPPGITRRVNTLQGGTFSGLDTNFPAQAEYQFSLGTTLGHSLGATGWSWYLSGDYSRLSKQYDSVFNYAWIGPRENLNMRLGLRRENLEVNLWGRNVTDDETPLTIIRQTAMRDDDGPGPRNAQSRAFAVYLPEPRTIGLQLTYRY